LQAKEHAAAEKQLAAQVATDPSAGSAIQLSAAPILIVIKLKAKQKRRRQEHIRLPVRPSPSRD
jgi:hypothetical protein